MTRSRRSRMKQRKLARVKAKALLLGAQLHWLPVGDIWAKPRWRWSYPPHASDYIFTTAQAAFDDLLRFITQRGYRQQ